jgi:hypothetical protein
MRRPRLILIALILALAGAAALLGRWFPARNPFDVRLACVRNGTNSMLSLVVEVRAACPILIWDGAESFQAKISGEWLAPTELWWEDHGNWGPFVACRTIDPRVEACRLSVTFKRESSYEEFSHFCVRHGLWNRFPSSCWWAARQLPHRTSRRHGVLELALPRDLAHNETLHWTGSSRFSSVAMGKALAAAPGH